MGVSQEEGVDEGGWASFCLSDGSWAILDLESLVGKSQSQRQVPGLS